jgi:hypothetical protein
MTEPRRILTEDELKDAGTLNVFDSQGVNLPFSSVFGEQMTIVVFIRECLSDNIRGSVDLITRPEATSSVGYVLSIFSAISLIQFSEMPGLNGLACLNAVCCSLHERNMSKRLPKFHSKSSKS